MRPSNPLFQGTVAQRRFAPPLAAPEQQRLGSFALQPTTLKSRKHSTKAPGLRFGKVTNS